MRSKKRLLSILLIITMMFVMMPATAWITHAESDADTDAVTASGRQATTYEDNGSGDDELGASENNGSGDVDPEASDDNGSGDVDPEASDDNGSDDDADAASEESGSGSDSDADADTDTDAAADETGSQTDTQTVTQTSSGTNIYVIESAMDERYVLTVKNGSTANNAYIQLGVNKKNTAQKFRIEPYAGHFRIINVRSKKALTVQGSSKENGARIVQSKFKSTTDQLFNIVSCGDDMFYIVNVRSKKVIEVKNGKMKAGAVIQQATKHNYKRQRWHIEGFDCTAKQKISAAKISGLSAKYKFTGIAIKPKLTLTIGKFTLKRGTDYSIKYKNNTEPGTATIVITGKGKYTGTKKLTFKIKSGGWNKGYYDTSGEAHKSSKSVMSPMLSSGKGVRLTVAKGWKMRVNLYKNGVLKYSRAYSKTSFVVNSGTSYTVSLRKTSGKTVSVKAAKAAFGRISYGASGYDTFPYSECSMSLDTIDSIGVIGDSFASGSIYSSDGSHKTYYSKSWPQVLKQNLQDENPDLRVTNYSKGGLNARSWLSNTSRGLEYMLSCPADDLYIINLCINDYSLNIFEKKKYFGSPSDIHKGNSAANPDTFYGNYGKIIEAIKEHAPDAKIVIMSCARPDISVKSTMNPLLKKIASIYGLSYINLDEHNTFISSDWIIKMVNRHPTEAQIRDDMAPAIELLLRKCLAES